MEFALIVGGVLAFAFWLSQLVDLLRRQDSEFPSPNDRLIWVLVIILLPVLGCILYCLFRPIRTESSESLKREWAKIRSSREAASGQAS